MDQYEYREAAMQALRYDPETGDFTWQIKTHGMGGQIYPGDKAGNLNDQGYRIVGYKGKQYRAHRLAWLFMTGDWPEKGMDIDHINSDRDDNRWSNLRLATRSQNNRNGGITAANKSGCRGVSIVKRTGKWHARIKHEGKIIILGDYADINEAIAARKAAEIKYWGEWVPETERFARKRHA